MHMEQRQLPVDILPRIGRNRLFHPGEMLKFHISIKLCYFWVKILFLFALHFLTAGTHVLYFEILIFKSQFFNHNF